MKYALENGYFDHEKIENDIKFLFRGEMTFYNCWRSSSSQLWNIQYQKS